VPRPLTAQEQAQARQVWPRMNVAAVAVTDNATNRYNCLAWTLGISTSWIWPWSKPNVTKTDFDALYHSNGFTTAGAGPIAVFGLSPTSMTHGSISGPGHGPRWESKCGAWLRIQHGLAEMEAGTLYGNVLGFYSQPLSTTFEGPPAAGRLRSMKTAKITKDDIKFIRSRVQQVNRELKTRFDQAYHTWKETWNHPLIAINSSPTSRTQTPAFLELISLGPEILPLLMEKLTDPGEFFALQAVDRLFRPQFVISYPPEDPATLLGEQERAIETVKQWVRTEA
jgi:hypothetical protein